MRCNKGSWHAILVGLAVLVLIGFLSSCASILKPAKQKSYYTPQSTPVITSPITVDQADLNNDGKLDQSEIQILTHDRPSVMSTFMCIGGLVVAVCGLCVILSRTKQPTSSSANSVKADMGSFTKSNPSEDQIIVESKTKLDDGGDWLDSGQDFTGDPNGSSGGKREG
jgi:hypothetical protein